MLELRAVDGQNPAKGSRLLRAQAEKAGQEELMPDNPLPLADNKLDALYDGSSEPGL